MTKYIILNDLHLSETTEYTVFSILSFASSKVSNSTGYRLAILGDFYDHVYKQGMVDARLQQRVYNFFDRHFTKETLYLLPGNHDAYSGYQETALSIFKAVATVYERPTLDSDKILWLPYKDGGYPRDMIHRFKRNGALMCFTHNDFKYVNTRKNHMSREGMDPSTFDGIQVFNGHYHYPNVGQNVICVGSQYAVHKTETFDQKLLYTVHADIHQWSSEPIRFGRREFVYPIDYVQDLCRNYWVDYVKNKKNGDIPPPTYPTIQDSLVVELDGQMDAGLDFQVFCGKWLSFLKCPVHHRKKINVSEIKDADVITFDSHVETNIGAAVKSLYELSPDAIDIPLEQITSSIYKIFEEFEEKHEGNLYEGGEKNLVFDKIDIRNFCGTAHATISYDNQVTKIKGQNGAGKTVQYPTAFLYGMTGVMDDRFSEEKLVLSDMRADKTNKCCVTIYGQINKEPFHISRTYDGKKSALSFVLNGNDVHAPTTKKKQKGICRILFNTIIANNVCPHRYLHKLLLQRIVWKQGGRDSNFLKMKSDAFQTLLLETINKGHYTAFIKFIKGKISAQKKVLETHKSKLKHLSIVVQERKHMSENENLMLNAWCEHRRSTLETCKEQLKNLEQQNVPRTNVDAYIAHKVNVDTLRNRVKDLLESKEGTRWNPEYTLNKLEESYNELEEAHTRFTSIDDNLKLFVRCLETFKYIMNIFYKRICKILQQYRNKIDFSNMKTLTMLNGEPMKYLSGGEYEEKSLNVYLDFRLFIKQYTCWDCNLTIFDEPGTAMSTDLLQKFVDSLNPDRCNLVITHKPIKCPIQVYI